MAQTTPIHLMDWPESELIFQIIRGPNARNDFHIDPGDITLAYIDEAGKRRPDERDRLAWFCERCERKLHETAFSCLPVPAGAHA